MKFLSLCSGIEAASVAWHPLGFECLGVAEIEPFPSAVLLHHYPGVPNFGDISRFEEWPEEMFAEIDIIVGGPPCQSFSIAGLRKGLNDDRGNLTLTYVRIIDHADRLRLRAGKPPVICVYENVPGLLSDKTNAFGSLLGGLAGEDVQLEPSGKRWTDAGCVFGPERAIAWRIQDAQYHGLAQRRRRVFVVASAREGFDPAEVLLEFEGVRRDFAPRREKGEGAAHATAPCLTSSGRGVERTGDTRGQDPVVAVMGVTYPINTQIALRHQALGERTGMGIGSETDPGFTLQAGHSHAVAVAVPLQEVGKRTGVSTDDPRAGIGIGQDGDPMFTLQAGAQHGVAAFQSSQSGVRINDTIGTLDANYGSRRHNGVMANMAVRRLTPVECERLQGFPDDYTLIPWKKKPAADCPDGPRYKALGNSMAVPVMRWIGTRIAEAVK